MLCYVLIVFSITLLYKLYIPLACDEIGFHRSARPFLALQASQQVPLAWYCTPPSWCVGVAIKLLSSARAPAGHAHSFAPWGRVSELIQKLLVLLVSVVEYQQVAQSSHSEVQQPTTNRCYEIQADHLAYKPVFPPCSRVDVRGEEIPVAGVQNYVHFSDSDSLCSSRFNCSYCVLIIYHAWRVHRSHDCDHVIQLHMYTHVCSMRSMNIFIQKAKIHCEC